MATSNDMTSPQVQIINNVLSPSQSTLYYNELIKARALKFTPRSELKIRYYFKDITMQRDVCIYGDPMLQFKVYHGPQIATHEWTPLLLKLRNTVQSWANLMFNCVVISHLNSADVVHKHVLHNTTYPTVDILLGSQRAISFTNKRNEPRNETLHNVLPGSAIRSNLPSEMYYGLWPGADQTLILSFRFVVPSTKPIVIKL